jgi:hypothetical protein
VRLVRWSLYLLGGAFIVGFTQLLLSLVGVTSTTPPCPGLRCVLALAIRAVARPPGRGADRLGDMSASAGPSSAWSGGARSALLSFRRWFFTGPQSRGVRPERSS